MLAGVCGSQLKTYGDCMLSNEKCDSNGSDDGSDATTCAADFTSLTTCCTNNPSAC
jgi:hypothetical protein